MGFDFKSEAISAPKTGSDFKSEAISAPKTGSDFKSEAISAPKTGFDFESEAISGPKAHFPLKKEPIFLIKLNKETESKLLRKIVTNFDVQINQVSFLKIVLYGTDNENQRI